MVVFSGIGTDENAGDTELTKLTHVFGRGDATQRCDAHSRKGASSIGLTSPRHASLAKHIDGSPRRAQIQLKGVQVPIVDANDG